MVRFRSLLERLNPRISTEKVSKVDPASSSLKRDTDVWSVLERAIQRGLPEEVLTWRQNLNLHSLLNGADQNHNEADGADGAGGPAGGAGTGPTGQSTLTGLACGDDVQDQMNVPRYIRRCNETGGRILVTAVQLAVVERKEEVVVSLLLGLTEEQLLSAINAKIVVLEKDDHIAPKKSFAETRKFFSVSTLSTSSIPTDKNQELEVDWTEMMEWNTLDLAVKYDVESLKVLLSLMESQLTQDLVEMVLETKDSKGRTVLHLASRCGTSSTPVKLLLDLGAQLESVDDYDCTPLHVAVKFGPLDTVRVLTEHGAHRARCRLDISGRGLLHYSSNTDITRYLLRRGYTPDLNTVKYQTRNRGVDNVLVFLENTLSLQGDLLILDFSLAMEQDQDGNLDTDGESEFLKNFLSHRKLLRAPIAESLLWMKWFACKRVILLDLFFYFIFISFLTGVICYSTDPGLDGSTANITMSRSEIALVDLVVKNYRAELENRGWKFVPRSTSNFDSVINKVPTNSSHPQISTTVFELASGSQMYKTFFGFYYFTVVLSALFLLREFLELIAQGPAKYFKSVENIFEVFIICLTILCQIFIHSYSANVYLYEILQVLTVFFGWFGLTFHLAKLPAIGIYIYLAIKVFRQLVLSLLVFTTILLAFAFSFHLALRKHHVFDNAFTSFLKTINMMAGEYNFDYNFTFQSVRDVGGSNGVVQVLLVCFILLVSITIANLIIAIVIANINKMLDEAEYYQLGKTVDLLSTVHNVKQTLIRIFPCSKQVFAPTLHDYVGKRRQLCVKISEIDPPLSWLLRLQVMFRSTTRFYPVYTFNTKYRDADYQTDLVLPARIVSDAVETCRDRKQLHQISYEGSTGDYSSDWRDRIGDDSLQLFHNFTLFNKNDSEE